MYFHFTLPITLFFVGLMVTGTLPAAVDYVNIPLATGFDYPVGKPDSKGYYKARGFWPNGHLGEDWNGRGGGNTDLGDPVTAIGDGVVVQSRDLRMGWGNVVIIRHVFKDKTNKIRFIDSLYGHLNERTVVLNQRIKKGQKIGTIGTNHGMYIAHLHFEIRKNISIGMHRSRFAKTYANYYSPSSFINSNRQCPTAEELYAVPIDTFAPYPGGNPVSKKTRLGTNTIKKSTPTKTLKIPIPKARTTKNPTSEKPRLLSSLISPPKLSPKVNDVIRENKNQPSFSPSSLDRPEPKKRIGLLSRLRSRFSKESRPRSNRGPRGLFPRRR